MDRLSELLAKALKERKLGKSLSSEEKANTEPLEQEDTQHEGPAFPPARR